MQLQYYTHSNIDFAKWDAALQNCTNALIYAQSIYLNTMCVRWDAIISADYSYMMPIPIKVKIGIRYTPVVPFIQQLGIFSSFPITDAIQDNFITLLQKKVWLANYNFNYSNSSLYGEPRINYILPLQANYDTLYASFKKDFKKDIKKVDDAITDILTDADAAMCIAFFKAAIGSRIPHVQGQDYTNLIQLCMEYKKRGQLITKAVTSKNGLLATAIFFKDAHRIYNIASAINKEGKKLKANHLLFNDLIKTYANSTYILDFEGSDIEGIAQFYQQFGSIKQLYYSFDYNQLPWPLRLLKK
jgi:hypothetical protein